MFLEFTGKGFLKTGKGIKTNRKKKRQLVQVVFRNEKLQPPFGNSAFQWQPVQVSGVRTRIRSSEWRSRIPVPS